MSGTSKAVDRVRATLAAFCLEGSLQVRDSSRIWPREAVIGANVPEPQACVGSNEQTTTGAEPLIATSRHASVRNWGCLSGGPWSTVTRTGSTEGDL